MSVELPQESVTLSPGGAEAPQSFMSEPSGIARDSHVIPACGLILAGAPLSC